MNEYYGTVDQEKQEEKKKIGNPPLFVVALHSPTKILKLGQDMFRIYNFHFFNKILI